MKLTELLLITIFSFTIAANSYAEIYKWKDKNGQIRYSDTPPPSNIKQEAIGRKKAVTPTGNAPLSPVQDSTAVISKDMEQQRSPEDIAAEQRQRNAESEKNNKKEKEAEAKRKAENCSAAKANMQTYTQGGRVYKMNERGEREYLDDTGFKAGRADAQRAINENC